MFLSITMNPQVTIDRKFYIKTTKNVNLFNEILILRMLPYHPNIRKFVKYTRKHEAYFEWIDGLDLCDLVRNGQTTSWTPDIWLKIFKQVLEALEHCHKHGVVVRDIKPDNIIVDVNNDYHTTLIDFGNAWSKKVKTVFVSSGTFEYLSKFDRNNPLCITPYLDIFSLAKTFIVAVMDVDPLNAVETFDNIPDWLEPIVRPMLADNIYDRPNASEILTTLNRIVS